MLVKKWMSKNVISVQTNDSVIKAQLLLKEHNINRLPVMDKGKLVGIITERDLRILPAETLRVKNIRMHGMDRDRLTRFKQSLEKKATLLYIVDLSENKRDIYKF